MCCTFQVRGVLVGWMVLGLLSGGSRAQEAATPSEGAASDDVANEIEVLKQRVAELEEKIENPLAGIENKKPYLRSSDDNFRLNFGGRLQARYTYQARDTASGRSSSDRSWAELERARVRVEGHMFDPAFQFRVEFDGHTDSEELELTDAYLKFQQKPEDLGVEWALGAGQWKPFFGRQEKQSSAQQILVDRSLANEYFNIDRNIGLWLEGRMELAPEAVMNALAWEVAITNGIDSANQSFSSGETDHIPAFIAHVDLDILGNLGKDALTGGDLQRRTTPGWTVGTSFMSDQNNNSDSVNNLKFKVYQWAVDTVFKYQGFNLNAEFFSRWLEFRDQPAVGSGSWYTPGGYLEGGYMLTDKLQVVGRASAVWAREGPDGGNAVEAGAGVNYFFFGHGLKFSADVLYLDVPANMLPQTEKLPGHTAGIAAATDFDPFSSSSSNLDEMQGVMFRVQLQLYF